MKKDIHPNYFPKAKIQCACGNTIEVGSTLEKVTVEVCSACHPLYTGKQKFIDKAGRVEKFLERAKKTKAKTPPDQTSGSVSDSDESLTLRENLPVRRRSSGIGDKKSK